MARPPDQHYIEGRNGFIEHPGDLEDPSQPSFQHLEAARRALYILAHKCRPIPSLAQMTEELSKPLDAEMAKQRVIDIKEQYLEDVSKLHQLHGQEYYEDAMDKFLCKDETQFLTPGENNTVAIASYNAMQDLYENSRDQYLLQSTFDDDRSRLDYAYLQTINPLRIQLAKLIERDSKLQRIKDQNFPTSLQEYRSMDNAVQLRVAKFLDSDESGREAMRSQYGWAWRQTKTLQDLYTSDTDFMSEITDKLKS